MHSVTDSILLFITRHTDHTEFLTASTRNSIQKIGTFLFQMATLSEEEKEYAVDAFGSLPTATIDEALHNFHKVR